MRIEDLIPSPQFREHHSRYIEAAPEAVWAALQDLRLGDLPISRALMTMRELPARLAGLGPSTLLTEKFLEQAPMPVVAVEPCRYIVAAGVMQAWKLTGGQAPPRLTGNELRGFREPGWIKLALDFQLVPVGRGTRFSTETRVVATDGATRVRFMLYWVLIRAGSGLIRRDLLRAVGRSAERSVPSP